MKTSTDVIDAIPEAELRTMRAALAGVILKGTAEADVLLDAIELDNYLDRTVAPPAGGLAEIRRLYREFCRKTDQSG